MNATIETSQTYGRTAVKTTIAGSGIEAAGGAAAVVLSILGLVNIAPEDMLPIAAIVVGAALLAQAGLLAAGALHALEHHVARLADDHALARRLADGLQGLPGVVVEPPQTNIVFVDLVGAARERSADLLAHLAAQGVQATGLYRLRFVTHLDVDAAGVDRAVIAIRTHLQA